MIDQVPENPKPLSTAVPDEKPVPFQCRVCGECCSSFNIPIEAEKARHLLSRDWAQARLAETRRELVRVTEALYRIPLTDQNVCVFLAENNHCLIERHEGKDAKPTECRNFPFAAVQLPDGQLAYDTSANCKTVAEKLLLAFRPIVPASGEEPALETQALPTRIQATPGRFISVGQYQAYQARLRTIFETTAHTPDEALRLAWLALQGREATSPGFRLSARLERWFTLACLRKPYGAYSWVCLLLGRPYADPRIFGEPVDLRGQAFVGLPESTYPLMRAFLYNLLQRKVLLTRGASLADQLGLAVAAYGLLKWYARTLAHITARNTVTEADVSMAIRLVERYYTGHQPRFLASMQRFHRGWLLVRLALRP